MAKYLDENGLLYFWQKIKALFALKTEVPSAGSTTPAMDGTGATGSSTAYARADHVHPTDTSRAPTSHATPATTYGAGTGSSYGHVKLSDSIDSTSSASSGIAATPKAVKDAIIEAKDYADIVAGETNQNAFSNVKVGSTTVAADTTTDTLELVAGSNVTLTPDATNDKITIAATDTTYNDATTSAHGLMTAADKTKLNGIATGAEVNQNALASVYSVDGDDTFTASSKTDTLKVIGGGGTNTFFQYGEDEDARLMIWSDDTKITAGATDSSERLFLIGAISQSTNPQTFSQDTAYVGSDGHLYSDSKQVVNLSGSQALTHKTYNGYSLGEACCRSVATSIAAGSTATTLPTCAAVEARITAAIASAQTGAAMFQGTVNASTDISGLTSYKKGWYWVVATAGTYAGQTCEAGDMIFCISDYSSSYKAADFSIVQNNIVTITNAEIDTIVAA